MGHFRMVGCMACPGGDGTIIRWTQGSAYNIPRIILEDCPVCLGTGEVSRCSRCEQQEDICQCPGMSEKAFLLAFEGWWRCMRLQESTGQPVFRRLRSGIWIRAIEDYAERAARIYERRTW